jgi:hypothetical protein
MGLGNKGNKFNFGDNDLADEASGADGDEGDGFGSVACSICLETVVKNGDRAWANLQCDHQFHLGEFVDSDTILFFLFFFIRLFEKK